MKSSLCFLFFCNVLLGGCGGQQTVVSGPGAARPELNTPSDESIQEPRAELEEGETEWTWNNRGFYPLHSGVDAHVYDGEGRAYYDWGEPTYQTNTAPVEVCAEQPVGVKVVAASKAHAAIAWSCSSLRVSVVGFRKTSAGADHLRVVRAQRSG